MISVALPEFMIVLSTMVLVFLLLTEILDWVQLFSWGKSECHSAAFRFGYGNHNGPHVWKVLYPESNGSNQSPINIASRLALVVQPCEALQWTGYNSAPLSMTITNFENTVILNAMWDSCARPHIEGGPLTSTYDLCSIVFHWGHSNEEGSEHTLDYVRYPMELQVVHIKRGLNSPIDAADRTNDAMVIASFFFQITNADNPYLDHIVTNLWRIIRPGSKVHIPPFPLEWIFPTFERNYYAYSGSLTRPPCSEIVTWIIQPEPIAISSDQVAQFRKIYWVDGPVLTNCRPVQRLNERDVYFHE